MKPPLFGKFEVILSSSVIISAIFISFFLPLPSPKSPITQITPISPISPTSSPTSDWKEYTDPQNIYSFKYPPTFSLTKSGDSVTINSPIYSCTTSASGSNTPIQASEVKLTFILHTGANVSELENNFDSQTTIGGKNAYLFYQGAESPFTRTTYLVELTKTTALEINSYSPQLIHNCPQPLNPFSPIPDQILSTFKFTN